MGFGSIGIFGNSLSSVYHVIKMPGRQRQSAIEGKMSSACKELAAASYACLEKNMGDGSHCKMHFDAYKACKKEERNRMLDARRRSYEEK
jgi:hypothetical protein